MKRRIYATFLLVLLAGCSSVETKRQQAIERGNGFFQAGKFEEAEIHYRRAIQASPGHSEGYYRLGLTAIRLQKWDDAYQNLTQAAATPPSNEEAKARLGDLVMLVYSQDPKRPEALHKRVEDISTALLAKDRNSYDGLRLQGYLRMSGNDTEEALRILERAAAQKPHEVETVVAIAGLLDRLDRRKEADQRATAYLAGHRDQLPIYDYLYAKYVREKRTADAERVARARAEAFPKNSALAVGVCAHYVKHGQQRELQQCLQDVRQKHGGEAAAWLHLGNLHLFLNELPAALEAFDEGAKRPGADAVALATRAAETLQRLGRLEEGIGRLDRVLKQEQGGAEALAMRGRLLAATGKAENLERAVRELEAVTVKNPVHRLDLAKARLAKRDYPGAAADLRRYVSQYGGDESARLLLAELSDQNNDHQTALEQAEALLRTRPDDAKLLTIRNRGLMGLGKLAEAKAGLDGLLQKEPGNGEAQIQRAFLTLSEGKSADAERAFRKLYAPGRADKRPLAGLVEVQLLRGETDGALTLIEADLQASADPDAARKMLAATALRAGRPSLAVAQYLELVKKWPADPNLHQRLGEAYQLSGNPAGARQMFTKVAQLAPQSTVPQAALALTEVAEGRMKEAEAALRKVIQASPADASARNNLAYLLATTGGNLGEAEQLALDAVRREAKNDNFADTLGYVYLQKKQYDAAIQVFQRIVAASPGSATYRFHLAQAHLEKGDMTKAREHFTATQKLALSQAEKQHLEVAMARLR